MSTYNVTFVDGGFEKIEAENDHIGEGVMIFAGKPLIVIPLAQIKKVSVYESAT